jgi:hypothetical protein
VLIEEKVAVLESFFNLGFLKLLIVTGTINEARSEEDVTAEVKQ